MNKRTFTAHPITILYLLRRWWFVFTAPVVRIVLEYLISKEAQKFLLSEVVLLLVAFVMSVVGWLFTKITVTNDGLVIKRGFLVKTQVKLLFSQILSLSANKNLGLLAIGCEKCKFSTLSKQNKSCAVNLSPSSAKAVYKLLGYKIHNSKLKRDKRIKRYITIPISTFFAITVAFLLFIIGFNFKSARLLVLYGVFITLFSLYLVFCYYDYKYGFICLKDKISINSARGFNIKRFCCCKNNVGVIKIVQNPFDRRHKTCKVKIVTLGEGGGLANIKYVKTEDVAKQLKNTFNANINV